MRHGGDRDLAMCLSGPGVSPIRLEDGHGLTGTLAIS